MDSTPSGETGAAGEPSSGNERRERDFLDRSPPDRFCDLVLSGGVTSAIAYPGLIFGLAKAYRFHGLAGSSSGAGTAALAAAAEYRRRRGSPEGFRTMVRGSLEMREDAVPAVGQPARQAAGPEPAATRAAGSTRKDPPPARGTRLSWLFQPDPELRRLFDGLAPGIAAGSGARVLLGLLHSYRASLFWYGLAFALVSFAVLWALDALGIGRALLALAGSAAFGLVGALLGALWPDIRCFQSRDFGLCTGQQSLPGAPHPPLTLWLHRLIQQVAGRAPGEAPLTFADLQGVRGGPDDLLGQPRTRGTCSIDLRMYTSNVTQRSPWVFPQAERAGGLQDHEPPVGAAVPRAAPAAADDTLYFKPAELRELFPDEVVDHMKAHSEPLAGAADGPVEACLWTLPRSQLPIIVAARMSVAFPVLFRAVPLWTRRRCLNEDEPDVFERCLFADGSLCSNFPVHLFDSLLPAWPTFGLMLIDRPDIKHYREEQADAPLMVKLPEASYTSREDLLRTQGVRERPPLAGILGYAMSMVSTMMHWHDVSLAGQPGFRERVVQVGLPEGIGGLNIFMNRGQIDYLASLGEQAARVLIRRYAEPDQPGGVARGWREHRWVRLNLLRDGLRESLAGLGAAANHARHTLPLSRQVAEATEQPALTSAGRPALLPSDAAALQAALSALTSLESALGQAPAEPTFDLHPRPVLRVQRPS